MREVSLEPAGWEWKGRLLESALKGGAEAADVFSGLHPCLDCLERRHRLPSQGGATAG